MALVSLAVAAPATAANGTWERAWGKDVVIDTETCTTAASCKAGVEGGLGGEFDLPAGAATDADGNVYVAERDNHRIQKFDSSGTFLRAWGKDVVADGGTGFEVCTAAETCKAGTAGGLGGELNSPWSLAVDQGGNVYVADATNNRVQKFDSSGTFLRAWGKDVVAGGGTGSEVCTAAASCKVGATGGLGGEFDNPLGIATDATGRVLVAEAGSHRIQRFDSSGGFEHTWGKDVDAGGGTGFEVCTTAASCKAGAIGALGGELWFPTGLSTDASGNLYVVDLGNQRIQKLDSSGSFERAWGKDVDSSGGTGFEVCTTAASCKAGVTGGLGGEFNGPRGIDTEAGSVFVADGNNNRIQRFDSSGSFERTWGKDVVTGGGTGFEVCTIASSCKAGATGGLGGELNFSTGVATDAAGNVFVADQFNHRIQRFDSSGSFDRTWGKDVVIGGAGPEVCTAAARCKKGEVGGLGGELFEPSGLATDAAGNVYVADQFNHRIQKFDSSGTFLLAWGKDVASGGTTGFEVCTVASSCKTGVSGGLGGELNFPYGVATDVAGNVYVVDRSNHRVQKFDSTGTWERAWGKDVDTGGGTDLEVCTTAASCKAGATGGLGGEFNNPLGAAVDAAGDLYVVDSSNHRVQKFDSAGGFERTWGKDVDSAGGTGFEVCAVASSCKTGVPGGFGGELNSPQGVATDVAGKIYVTDPSSHRIQKFDSSGGFERTWGRDVVTGGDTGFEVCTAAASCKAGTAGGLGGEFNLPVGIATDAAGWIYVAEQGNHRIQKLDSSGGFQRTWGKDVIAGNPTTGFEICTAGTSCKAGASGGLGGELVAPSTVAASTGDNLYVGANNRIQKYADPPPPSAPLIEDTDPDSPSNSSTPSVKGSASADTATIEVFTQSNCQGSSTSGSKSDFEGLGISVSVSANQTSQLSALARNADGTPSECSTDFPYTHDDQAPAAPSITDTDPDSPSSDETPAVKGTVGAGDPTQVKIYTSADCSGSPAKTGTVAQFTGTGIDVTVSEDAQTELSARTTDAAGNDSTLCSNSITYTEDSTAPAAPSIIDSDPDSPADHNSPRIKGNAESDSVVRLFLASECPSGTALGTSSAAAFAAPGIAVSVPDNSTTTFAATAEDQAGNTSTCSAPFTYREVTPPPPSPGTDTTPPETQIDSGPPAKSKSRSARFESSSTEPGSTFECKLDSGPFRSCASPKSYSRLKKGRHSFHVRATDAVGNTDPTPATRAWTVKKKKKKK